MISCKNNGTAEQPLMPAATATPATQKDEHGNFINPDGWTLPVIKETNKEKSTRIEKHQDGTTVKVSVVSYSIATDPDHRVVLEGPFRPGGQASVITSVAELSGRDGKAFCFIYTFSPFTDEGRGEEMTVIAKSRLCDMDGDGKFELKGDGLGAVVVADWAK
ncbi:MAG: hypothetical protein ABI999_05860 [Acidobacteriota bacterium]